MGHMCVEGRPERAQDPENSRDLLYVLDEIIYTI